MPHYTFAILKPILKPIQRLAERANILSEAVEQIHEKLAVKAFAHEDKIKSVLQKHGHIQCAGGGCGHGTDAVIHGRNGKQYGLEIGDKTKDHFGQGSLKHAGGKWSHEATSGPLNKFIHSKSIQRELRKKYGVGHKEHVEVDRKTKTKKVFPPAAAAIRKHGDHYMPGTARLVRDHLVKHKHSHYVHIEGKGLYRTTAANPAGIRGANGKPPPILPVKNEHVKIRTRLKSSSEKKKVGNKVVRTGNRRYRAATVLQVRTNKFEPSHINLERPETLHPSFRRQVAK